MIRFAIPFFTMLVLVSFTPMDESQPKEIVDYCTRDLSRRKTMKALPPYRYSGSRTKSFTLQNFSQVRHLQIDLVRNRPYRIIFNREGVPEGQLVEIAIYDRPHDKRNRQVLWHDESTDPQVIFETKYVQFFDYDVIYVDVLLPAYEGDLSGPTIKGCLITTVGYQNVSLSDKRPKTKEPR